MTYLWQCTDDQYFELLCDDTPVLKAYCKACDTQGREIESRHAQFVTQTELAHGICLTYQADNGLILQETLTVENGTPVAMCTLKDASGAEVETNRLVPLVLLGERGGQSSLWKSLWTQMLVVPYDNDMWLRYGALPWRAGQKSYDLTVLFDPASRCGLLVGAIDFGTWKNALVCSAYDARHIEARCGEADEGTHDTMAHGTVKGCEVVSSRYCVTYGPDYRTLLEDYARLVKQETTPLVWDEGNPFGFNSWAGLAARLGETNFRNTGKFLREKLIPNSFNNNGISYTNLDACWQAMGEKAFLSIKDELHINGQKAGIYDAPFAFFGKDIKAEIPGVPGHCFEEILLRDDRGELLPRVDGAYPLDLTHPLWKTYTDWKFRRFIDWGYDYVKVDFMSHGGMEGVHYDKSITTGRQAITLGYRYLAEMLAPEKVGRPFFISLSIAPLFPNGWGHARRFSCDAFGTNEDIEYVLNAQTYSWWANRTLYAYNDPDHIVLLRAFCMDRDNTEGEARARYTAAAIAGGVMMISDDYERPEAMARAEMFATNPEVNSVAAAQTAFVPVDFANAYASHAFTASINGRTYLALFSFAAGEETVSVSCKRANIPEGTYRDLWTGCKLQSENGMIVWHSEGCNALLLVLEDQ